MWYTLVEHGTQNKSTVMERFSKQECFQLSFECGQWRWCSNKSNESVPSLSCCQLEWTVTYGVKSSSWHNR